MRSYGCDTRELCDSMREQWGNFGLLWPSNREAIATHEEAIGQLWEAMGGLWGCYGEAAVKMSGNDGLLWECYGEPIGDYGEVMWKLCRIMRKPRVRYGMLWGSYG